MEIEFRSGQEIVTIKGARYPGQKSKGKVTGWVGYPKPNNVRVQWDDGYITDYSPKKLKEIVFEILTDKS